MALERAACHPAWSSDKSRLFARNNTSTDVLVPFTGHKMPAGESIVTTTPLAGCRSCCVVRSSECHRRASQLAGRVAQIHIRSAPEAHWRKTAENMVGPEGTTLIRFVVKNKDYTNNYTNNVGASIATTGYFMGLNEIDFLVLFSSLLQRIEAYEARR